MLLQYATFRAWSVPGSSKWEMSANAWCTTHHSDLIEGGLPWAHVKG